MVDLEEITEKVRELAIKVGNSLKEERKKFRRACVEEKHSHDYVSYVDKESERKIGTELVKLLPEAGFIAEEGFGSFTTEEYYWLVDPLDGTTNFIHDNAPYCISIALRNREELLIGVVYEVCREECYWAWKGSKAYLNGKEIHVSTISNLNDAFISLGLPYEAKAYKSKVLSFIDHLYGNVSGIRIIGAAAAELCYIAVGRLEARIESDLKPWDIAAGSLILMQAGGQVSDFSGGADFYSGKEVLASNGKVHSLLLNVVSHS